eukprot:m.434505 g.434505  ORF g.434505 m.434505 type:complete len:743 (-) comp21419_c0_seq52:2802-5030(-)
MIHFWPTVQICATILFNAGSSAAIQPLQVTKNSTPPFRNPNLTIAARVENLISLLSVEEKAQLIGKASGPIPRLGIESYSWRQGTFQQCNSGYRTAMPQNLGIAASFNVSNAFISGLVTGIEFRSEHMDYSKGLTCYGPMTNIFRNVMWGRNHEGYGEDPFLAGEMVYQMVQGLQGNDSKYFRVHAMCKHFSTFDGPGNGGDAWISDRDWFTTYLPPMKRCLDAGVSSYMCSYAKLNGVYGCQNPRVLNDLLRDVWNFDGFVMSDMGAIHDTVAAITAGCDLDDTANNYQPQLPGLIKQNSTLLGYLNTAFGRAMAARLRLGEFDPPDMVPYANPAVYNTSRIYSKEFLQHSHDAAVQTLVLLQNTHNTLPFAAATLRKLAVLGPGADNHGDPGYGPKVTGQSNTTRASLEALLGASRVAYAAGCDDGALCTNYNESAVSDALSGADAAVVVLTGQGLEAENHDRKTFELYGNTSALLASCIHRDIPFALVVAAADPFNITGIVDSIPAIIQAFYPQEYAGDAIAAVLLGDYNPAGRLPYTWPRSLDQVGGEDAIGNYTMKGKTYRYSQPDPLFPFGFGLSYTTFEYASLIAPSTASTCDAIQVNVTVKNTGPRDGTEVVQLYVQFHNPTMPTPDVYRIMPPTILQGDHVPSVVPCLCVVLECPVLLGRNGMNPRRHLMYWCSGRVVCVTSCLEGGLYCGFGFGLHICAVRSTGLDDSCHTHCTGNSGLSSECLLPAGRAPW